MKKTKEVEELALVEWRTIKNYSQQYIADQMGFHQSTVSKMEKGKAKDSHIFVFHRVFGEELQRDGYVINFDKVLEGRYRARKVDPLAKVKIR